MFRNTYDEVLEGLCGKVSDVLTICSDRLHGVETYLVWVIGGSFPIPKLLIVLDKHESQRYRQKLSKRTCSRS